MMRVEDAYKLREIVKRWGGIIICASQLDANTVRDLC